MTIKELKEHCENQVEMCEKFAHDRGNEPSGKIYEEHKLILKLLEEKTAGHWIEHKPKWCDNNWPYSKYECSVCHGLSDDDTDYCCHCGRYMI